MKDKIVTFTLSVPDELKKRLEQFPEINWPEYLKQRLELRAEELQRFEELKNRGKL